MRITKLSVRNFRCIEDLDLVLSNQTVIIGENNAGKSAVLDAVKIALSRRWGRSGNTGFSEFDFRFNQATGAVVPISLTLEFAESSAAEWPEEVTAALNDIIRTEPVNDLDSIAMRVNCSFEEVSKSVEPEWQFLNEAGAPYGGRGARNQNLQSFFDYVPCFSMAAIRDAANEFGNRSAFWTPLLKSIEVSPEKTAELEESFAQLNSQLLEVDPKIEQIKEALKDISSVIASGAAGDVDIRAIPVKLWDIIRRSELVVQGRDQDPWLPIGRHGHGVQSLSIIFLFRAYIENVLDGARGFSTPVLTLEEPEAHLHPQACRALWKSLSELPGQMVITTHSPYFVQNVPFKDLIILRRTADGTSAHRIRQSFHVALPPSAQLGAFIAVSNGKYSYDELKGELVCHGVMEEGERRQVLTCYATQRELHASIAAFSRETQKFLADEDILKLESWAKRIRGEIFFARKWLLCEGQAEHAVLSAIADQLGENLDANGIAVIDYQNNGSPGAFASLARSLSFEWIMMCDGDQGGDSHIAQLASRGFEASEIEKRVSQLGKSIDLEKFLFQSTFSGLFVSAVLELAPGTATDEESVLAAARDNKEQLAVRVASRIRSDQGRTEMPEYFANLFSRLKEM